MQQLEEEETKNYGSAQSPQTLPFNLNELNKGKVKYLGIFFMVLLSVLNSYFTYSSYLYNKLNYSKMGMLSVATFFIFSALGTIYAPWFSRTFFSSYSKKFFVAAIPHCLILFVGVVASTCSQYEEIQCSDVSLYILVFASSSICGLGNALIWVLQGAYITDCTSEKNKGEYFGIFLQLSQISNIIGPIVSSYLFKVFGIIGYFRVMFLITAGSSVLGLFVKEPVAVSSYENQNDNRASEYDQNSNIYFENYKELNEKLIRRNSTLFPVPQDQIIDLSRLKAFLVEKYQIKYYFAVFFLNGFYLGYYWSQIGFIAADKLENSTFDEKNQLLGLVFLLMGLIQVFFSRKMGASFDILEDKVIFYKRLIFATFVSITLVLIFYFLPFFSPFYLISIIFGLGEILIKSFIGGVLSLKFSDHSYESFAIYRLVSNIASGVAMILSSIFTPEVPLVMMTSLILNIYACTTYINQIRKHLSDQDMFTSVHSNY